MNDLEALADAVREAARVRPEDLEEPVLTGARRGHLRVLRYPED